MKFLMALLIATPIHAQTSAPNPASGGAVNPGTVSDGALGPATKKEKQEARMRAKSMDGAPNYGGGMGTGTGPIREEEQERSEDEDQRRR